MPSLGLACLRVFASSVCCNRTSALLLVQVDALFGFRFRLVRSASASRQSVTVGTRRSTDHAREITARTRTKYQSGTANLTDATSCTRLWLSKTYFHVGHYRCLRRDGNSAYLVMFCIEL